MPHFKINSSHLVFKYAPLLWSIFIFSFLISISMLSPGLAVYAGDNHLHYLIAKYAPLHPELLIHLWSKPIFTLFAMPFAQIGFWGVQIFNISCGVGAAYVTKKICDELNFSFSTLAIPLLCFSPVYMNLMLSTITEPLFSFMLTLVVLLLLKEKNMLGSSIASMLPFIRHEGFLILVLCAIYFLYKRKFREFILLFIIPAFYISAGIHNLGLANYFEQFYKTYYPSVDLSINLLFQATITFLVHYHLTTYGPALCIIGGFGAIVFLKTKEFKRQLFVCLMILAPYVINMFIQILIKSSNFSAVAIHPRFLAEFAPLFIITCIAALHYIKTTYSLQIAYIIVLTVLLSTLYAGMNYQKYPIPLQQEFTTFDKALAWVAKQYEVTPKYVVAYDPYIYYKINQDPWQKNKPLPTIEPFQIDAHIGNISEQQKKDTILIWDSAFGNYFKESSQALLENNKTKLLKSFYGKNNFVVSVFQLL